MIDAIGIGIIPQQFRPCPCLHRSFHFSIKMKTRRQASGNETVPEEYGEGPRSEADSFQSSLEGDKVDEFAKRHQKGMAKQKSY
jgi:hypothetical protein